MEEKSREGEKDQGKDIRGTSQIGLDTVHFGTLGLVGFFSLSLSLFSSWLNNNISVLICSGLFIEVFIVFK